MGTLIAVFERMLVALYPEQRVIRKRTAAIVLVIVAGGIFAGLSLISGLPTLAAAGLAVLAVCLALVLFWMRRKPTDEP